MSNKKVLIHQYLLLKMGIVGHINWHAYLALLLSHSKYVTQ